MAIDPELRQLIADLDRLNASARAAGQAIDLRMSGGFYAGMDAGTISDLNSRARRERAVFGPSELREADPSRQRLPFGIFGREKTGFRYARDIRNDIIDVFNVAREVERGNQMGALNSALGLLPPTAQVPARMVSAFFQQAVDVEDARKQNYKALGLLQDNQRKLNVGFGHTTEAYVQNAYKNLRSTQGFVDRMSEKVEDLSTGEAFLYGGIALIAGRDYARGRREEYKQKAIELVEKEARNVLANEKEFYKQVDLGNYQDSVDAMGNMAAAGALTGIGRDRIKEVGSPAERWYKRDQARQAAREWSALQSPRAGPRPEID